MPFFCETFVVKGRGPRSGSYAGKDRVLAQGDFALNPKGRRRNPEREVIRGHSRRPKWAKGRGEAGPEAGCDETFLAWCQYEGLG